MKNEQNAPKIRFKGFTDAWELREFDKIFFEYSEKNHEELPPLTIIQGKGTILRDESDRNLIYDKSGLKNYKLVNKNDFILHLRSFEGGLEMANSCGIVSPAYHIFHGEKIDSRFYYPFFRSKYFIAVLLKPHVYGIRDGKSIDVEGMKSITIPYPSLEEQTRIGQYFEQLDHLITLHQRKCETLQKLKKSMLQKMFPKNGSCFPEIRFAGFTDAWEQRELGECMETVTDYVAAGSFADIAENVQYKTFPDFAQLIRTVDLKHEFKNNDYIYVDKKAFDYLWKVNLNVECIILPNIGANIGEVYYIEPSSLPYENNVLGPNAIFLKAKDSTKFMYTLLQADDFQNKLYVSIASSGQPKFNKTELKAIKILIPNSAEQEKIGAYFRTLDHLITLHQRKLETLKKLKKAMLQKMFI